MLKWNDDTDIWETIAATTTTGDILSTTSGVPAWLGISPSSNHILRFSGGSWISEKIVTQELTYGSGETGWFLATESGSSW